MLSLISLVELQCNSEAVIGSRLRKIIFLPGACWNICVVNIHTLLKSNITDSLLFALIQSTCIAMQGLSHSFTFKSEPFRSRLTVTLYMTFLKHVIVKCPPLAQYSHNAFGRFVGFASRIGLDWACTVADILHRLNACVEWSPVIAAFSDHCVNQLPQTLKRTNLFTLLVLVGFPQVRRTGVALGGFEVLNPPPTRCISSCVLPSGTVCGHRDGVYRQRQRAAQHDPAQTLHREEPRSRGRREDAQEENRFAQFTAGSDACAQK